MSHLRVYTVHINPTDLHPYEKAEFLKEGFNCFAFVFTGFYALYKRLWWSAFWIFFFNLMLSIAYQRGWLHAQSVAAVNLGFQVFIGYQANDWIRERLRRRGYIVADLTSGENALRAEQRFYDRFAASHSLSAG